MTTLTQAQIEVAAKALQNYASNFGAKDCGWTVYIGEAKAALTAAAQVGKLKTGDTPHWAAAQVGEQEPTLPCAICVGDVKFTKGIKIATVQACVNRLEAATIERCAQVCDEAANDPRATKEYRYFCINMAAAIRKLGHET